MSRPSRCSRASCSGARSAPGSASAPSGSTPTRRARPATSWSRSTTSWGPAQAVTRRSACFRADRYAQAEDRDRAIALFTEGLEEHPDSPALLYDLACVEARAGRLDDAMRHLRAAAAANPAEVPRWAAGDRDLDALRGCDGFPA
ncbi:MAG TPA: tetratricopeptide repeat protein [Solirubrobacteraceae bacterium]|nr:tetratricopeptide repeat protein [Solirubrobacteraceae bacterium]